MVECLIRCTSRTSRGDEERSDGIQLQTAEHFARFRTVTGIHSVVSQSDSADSTVGDVPQSVVADMASVLACGYFSAGAGFLPAQLRRVRHRRNHQSVLWPYRRLRASTLQLSRQAAV